MHLGILALQGGFEYNTHRCGKDSDVLYEDGEHSPHDDDGSCQELC